MLSKLLSFFKAKSKYDDDDEVVIKIPNEYSLLVTKKRIIDYSKIKDHLNLPLKIGMYMDTFQFLKNTQSNEIATSNVEKVLIQSAVAYQRLIKEKFGQINDGSGAREGLTAKFDRTQQLFFVSDLALSNKTTEATFCVNLFTRPSSDSFIVIGREPKGKLKTPVDNETGTYKDDGSKEAWEYIEFE